MLPGGKLFKFRTCKQDALVKLRKRGLSAAFQTWRDTARRCLALKPKLASFVAKLKSGLLLAAWQSWKASSAWKVRRTAILRTAIGRLRQQVQSLLP